MISESTRLEYLQKLGIQPYFRRVDKPAATGEAAPALQSVKPPVARDPESIVRLRIAFVQVNDTLGVLNLLPHTGSRDGLDQRARRLLINLLRAMNIDAGGRAPLPEKNFHWPFSEAPHVDKSGRAAGNALRAWLSQIIAELDLSMLLLLGEPMQQYLPLTVGEDRQGMLSLQDRECRVLILRSLDEMLKLPDFKREIWRQIRSLH